VLLGSEDQALIREFREGFERRYAGDPRFRSVVREDRPDGSTLSTRFEVAPALWLEMALRPGIPQLRAGILTDDRWKNEDLETAIEETGDTMSEFVELGFDEAGLEWPHPPVEHYRDQGKYFCFSTAFELGSLAELRNPATVSKLRGMFEGYYAAFRAAIAKAAAAA
jgi:hypothetical protein